MARDLRFDQDHQERSSLSIQALQETKIKNQTSREEVGSLGAILPEALRQSMDDGPLAAGRRVARELNRHVPGYAENWGGQLVRNLVESGRLPEYFVCVVLANFRSRLRHAHEGRLSPVRDPAAYLSSLFKQIIEREGLLWRKSRLAV